MSIAILGAGAFGTSLAISFARSGTPVTLCARDADSAADIQSSRANPRLPGVTLPPEITVTSSLNSADHETILLAVPMQTLRSVLQSKPEFDEKTLVACCKGIELTSGKGPVAIISECLRRATPAILTGPSFAHDIARGLPTALTLACQDEATGQTLQNSLVAPNLRIYRTTDTTGAELGGALKNVIAIACGAAIGAGLGDSARAAVMTRGFAEMNRMASALGANPDTLAGLSGFGDLALTCTSEQSRNYRFGLALGRDETFDPSITVEGAATARATLDRAGTLGIEMPITTAVVALLDQKMKVREAMEQLLSRPPKEE
jgi:glycerol-3-phosphate dehydrogenase (NAD(P)+)